MDATIASPPTHGWELLTQLALCGQKTVTAPTSHDLARESSAILQRYLPASWGLLVLIDAAGAVVDQAGWGLDATRRARLLLQALDNLDDADTEQEFLRLQLRADQTLLGYLLLPTGNPPATASHPFFAALAAQLSLLLRQRLPAPISDEGELLLQRRAWQLRALQRISSQLTSTLLQEEIFAFVLEEALRATGAAHGLIILRPTDPASNMELIDQIWLKQALGIDPDRDGWGSTVAGQATYTIAAVEGFTATDRAALLQRPVDGLLATAQTALQRGEPIFTTTLTTAERRAMRSPQAHAALAAPIFYEDDVAGVVMLLAGRETTFDHDTIEFVRTLADQTAVAIGNAQRYSALEQVTRLHQRRTAMLKQMLEIGQVLRSDQSLGDILEQIGYSVIESANYRTAIFSLTDRTRTDHLRALAAAGIPRQEFEQIRAAVFPKELAWRYLHPHFRLGRCFFVPAEAAAEIEADFDTTVLTYHASEIAHAPDEWQRDDRLIVPLYSTDGHLLGLLMVAEPLDRRRPNQRTVEPLEIFADQAAIAIENHYLLHDARARAEQMTALFQVGAAATSTVDLDTLLQRVYQEIEKHLGTPSFFSITSYEPENDQLHFELFMREGAPLERLQKQTISKSGLTGLIIDRDVPLLISDWQHDESGLTRHAISLGEPVSSWMGVPLRSQNRVIGVLTVQSFQPHAFSERDQQFLMALANQLAIALENARLFQERERRLAELAVINRIANITNSTLDLQPMIGQVYTQLAEFLALDAAYIFIYRASRDEITLSLEVDEGAQRFDTSIRQPAPESLTARIIRTRQPLLFRDLESEAQAAGLQPVRFGNTSRSSAAWIGVPLMAGNGAVVGVLSVQSYEAGRYGQRDLAFLQTVASQLALGVQNALLLAQAREQVQQIGLLNHVSTVAATTLETELIYQAGVNAMAQAIGADQARLIIYDQATGTAQIVAEYQGELPPPAINIDLTDNPGLAWLADEHRPLTVHATQHDPLFERMRPLFKDSQAQTMTIVPLIIGNEVIGAFSLEFGARQLYLSQQKIDLCQTIANQTATAIENARLFMHSQSNAQALETKVGELSTLLDAARILSSLLRPDEVLDKLMDLVSRQLGVTTVALWTVGSDNIMTPAAMDGIPADVARNMRVPVGEGLTGQVAESGMPLVISDVDEHGGSLYPTFQRNNQLVSFMGVPVVYRERTIGVLSVMTNERREFSDDEMLLLVGLADQAAIALENARLFQERERRINELETINRISVAVNARLEPDDLLRELHRGIGEVLDTSCSFIGLYSADDQRLHIRAARTAGATQSEGMVLAIDSYAPLQQIIATGQPLLLATPAEVGPYGPPAIDAVEPAAAFLGVPIMRGAEVLGLIGLWSNQTFAYNNDDARFLTTVSGQAAVALANARLFSERERRLREVEVLKDIGSAATSTLELQDVLERLHRALGRVIDTSTSLIGFYDEHTNILSYPIVYDEGRPVRLDPVPLPRGTSGWAIRNRRPLLLHTASEAVTMDLDIFSGRIGDDGGEQSFLVAPIIYGERVLGVINVQSYTPHAFDEDDLRFITAVAHQAAVAINNAHLFTETRQNASEMTALYEVSLKLAATLDPTTTQQLVAEAAIEVLGGELCGVLRFDDVTGQMQPVLADRSGRRNDLELTVRSDGWTRQLLESDGPMAVTDLHQAPDANPRVMALGVRSTLGMAIGPPGKRQGVIWVGLRDPHEWTERQTSLLSIITNQAHQAFENAHLFAQIRTLNADLERRVEERTAALEEAKTQISQEKESLEAVHAITLELTTMHDLNEIIERALALVSRKMGVARGSIMLREDTSGALICRAVLDDQGQARGAHIPISFGQGEGLAGWVMAHQQSVCIPDVRRDRRWVLEAGRAEDVRSAAAVPLQTTDTTLGVLILSSPKVNYFTDSQIHLLGTIANVVAIAISNAQLYSYISEMASRLAESLNQQREETSRSQAILRSVSEGVIMLDPEQRVTLFNPAAEHVLDIPASTVMGQPIVGLREHGATEAQRQRAAAIYSGLFEGLQAARERQGIYSMSLDLDEPTQIIAVNLAPVVGNDGSQYGNVAVLRDITREIEADRAKREFVSNVSHELRTPLTAIKGRVDLLLLGLQGPLTDDQKDSLRVAQTNANRLRDLITDILDISGIESGKIKLNFNEVSIAAVVNDVVQSLRLETERKQMSVAVDLPADLPPVVADERRITQVVFNLFSNAVKYTFPGGRIAVRTFLNRANMMQIDVEDTGVGMTPEQRQKLFRPFYRADNPLREEAGGTGLGLSIARSLVEQHGGEMWVSSEPGKGSTFSFIIPLQQPEPDATEGDVA